MQGEAVGDYTPEYASPEVAKAVSLGIQALAHTSMDVFSFGLVALEMLRGALRHEPAHFLTSREEARSTLSSDGLEAILSTAIEPLPSLQQLLLRKMLAILPAERDSAAKLKKAGVLTGNVRSLPAQSRCALSPPMRASPIALNHLAAGHYHDQPIGPAGEGSAFF